MIWSFERALLALSLGLVLLSGGAAVEAKAKNSKLLPGYAAKENIDRVNQDIQWHTHLSEAIKSARSQGKMILWVQMIGQMDGAT